MGASAVAKPVRRLQKYQGGSALKAKNRSCSGFLWQAAHRPAHHSSPMLSVGNLSESRSR